MVPGPIVVFFAVREERRAFHPSGGAARVILTGMGQSNAREVCEEALRVERPRLVFSCGFAGGLHPELEHGRIVYCGAEEPFRTRLENAGATWVRFVCSERVAVSAREKRELHRTSRADAVEMESSAISRCCAESGVPCLVVRVILDPVQEDLPLDFNALMKPSFQIDYRKLLKTLAFNPRSIPALLAFRRRTLSAALALGRCLDRVVRG